MFSYRFFVGSFLVVVHMLFGAAPSTAKTITAPRLPIGAGRFGV
jgi:hypothetical protein